MFKVLGQSSRIEHNSISLSFRRSYLCVNREAIKVLKFNFGISFNEINLHNMIDSFEIYNSLYSQSCTTITIINLEHFHHPLKKFLTCLQSHHISLPARGVFFKLGFSLLAAHQNHLSVLRNKQTWVESNIPDQQDQNLCREAWCLLKDQVLLINSEHSMAVSCSPARVLCNWDLGELQTLLALCCAILLCQDACLTRSLVTLWAVPPNPPS